jgi:uncharacterized membrane protein
VPPVHVAVEQTLSHPVDAVFRFMADPANRPRWQEHTQRVEMLSEGPAAVGTRWRETTAGLGTYDAEVVALEPGRLWVEEADTSHGHGRISVAFAAEGEAATHVTVTVEINLRGMRRMMGAALAPMISRQLPRDLERLDAVLGGAG